MDPVTHTLVGATLAQTGFKRRTALGAATLVVGAVLPDIDVLAYFWGSETAVWFRRGLTHGVLALIVLPCALAGLVLLWDRLVRRRLKAEAEPAVGRQVLMLAVMALATHPLLDFLNSYGTRWLAPFSQAWSYGDTLFIFDPWVWAILAAGLWLSRGGMKGPRLALGVASGYVVLMALSNVAARGVVRQSLRQDGVVAERIMTAPLAAAPFERWVVVESTAGYLVGLFNWLPAPRLELHELPYHHEPPSDAAVLAAEESRARKFLSWARFPYYLEEDGPGRHRLHLADARYTVDPYGSWASTSVTVRGVALPD
ncbi:MAG: metal-dependent hydrolase [Gemmatimonadota bacterium]|nr:MAG: metal-dependent hydrolase [Gemmatimonadota bacterium]